jgi:valyl-tRNA synthetase
MTSESFKKQPLSMDTMVQEVDLPQRHEPKQVEAKWQKYWEDEGIFVHEPTADSFVIDTPPPTVSGKMHIGHAYSYAQQDFYARFQRMKTQGKVFFPFGTDDNGLPTEKLVEKLKSVKSTKMSRADFRKLCFDTINEIKPDFVSDWKRLGMSCDFNKTYSTIDPHCQATSQRSFIDLFKKGRVYRQESPVAWCVFCQTAIAQADFENIELQSMFNDVNFSIEGKPVTIATTRPELIPAVVAVAAHPEDNRYTQYEGKRVTIPLFDYDVPLVFDTSVDMEKGTGLMMVSTFGDKDDIDKWFRHKLQLRVVLTRDGKLNELAGKYAGLPIKDARKVITEDLKAAGHIVAQKAISHAVNVHERCNTEIEFLKTPQWYVKVLDIKEELVNAGQEIEWHPEFMFVRYKHWVENLNWDWCISRQRYFGVPFPVWYGDDGKLYVADEDQLPVDPFVDRPKSAPAHVKLTPETDVMDTWATSSVTPQIILNWHESPAAAQSLLPTGLRPQGQDIIRTWAFYTIVKAKLNNGVMPWKNIAISGYVTDPHGQKMSKSKGNVVDPRAMMDKYCADVVRFWAAGNKLGEDVPFQERELQTGNRTMTKLWNASKLTLMSLADYHDEWTGRFDELEIMDRWILSKLNKVISACDAAFATYEHGKAKLLLEQFFWSDFCDNYLEIIKGRLYDPKDALQKRSAQFTLQHVLGAILKLFAPLMPFITEEIYHLRFAKLEGKKSIHISAFPEARPEWNDEQAEIVGAEIVKILEAVRKHKSTKQMAMNSPLAELNITTNVDLTLAENDLLSATKAQKLMHQKGEFAVDIP